jgi:hypothetical protein
VVLFLDSGCGQGLTMPDADWKKPKRRSFQVMRVSTDQSWSYKRSAMGPLLSEPNFTDMPPNKARSMQLYCTSSCTTTTFVLLETPEMHSLQVPCIGIRTFYAPCSAQQSFLESLLYLSEDFVIDTT